MVPRGEGRTPKRIIPVHLWAEHAQKELYLRPALSERYRADVLSVLSAVPNEPSVSSRKFVPRTTSLKDGRKIS